ncbi:MAG: beta strand repeat-containing protein, partial [Bacteroidota bacterium]
MQLIKSSLTILALLTLFVSDMSAQFAGGAGTSVSPYQVNTLAHLNTIAGNSSYWDKYFIQTANIDASSTSTQNSGAGFLGIGTISNTFIGSYDGQGYSITGLVMNRPTTNYTGMFNYVHLGAVVKNLNLVNARITGLDFVGGITGYADQNTTLLNLTVDAQSTVTGDDYVGGIAGEARNATLTGCISAATVSGTSAVGGVAGECWNDSNPKIISGCSSSGTVSATCCDLGGLVGINSGQTITNCYSSATVNCTGTTSTNVGGLIGVTYGPVSLCYSTGSVTSTTKDVGGLIGEIGVNGSAEKCYTRATVESTQDNVGGLVGQANGNVTNCFAVANVKAAYDVGGLVGVTRGTCIVSFSYAASRVVNTTDNNTGGIIGNNGATENNCFWIDLFSDDNATAPDETNDFDADFKIVSDVAGATKDFTVSALTGSNAPTTMSAFDFTNVWDVAPAGAPGSFPVLRNLTAPSGAPAAPTKFTIASGNNKLILAWASNYETDIASYKIYRSTTANFTPSGGNLLATVTHATGGLTYTDDGSGALAAPVNGTLYYYVLVAVDNSGNTSFYHRGAQKPAVYFANVSVSVLTTGGVTYADIHGSSASDISAVYSTTQEGNITNTNALTTDGSGTDQGIGHPGTITGGALTITPSGLQTGQNWYFYYDDATVSGAPIRNLTGGAGTGTTLVTGKGNTPVTVTAGLDPDFTDYLFYVDALRTNSAPSLNNINTLNATFAPVKLDADVTATDPESSAENGGAGNFNGFSLTIQRQGGASANDVVVLSAPDANYVISGGIVKYATKQVATYSLVAGVFTLQFSGTEVIPTQTIVNSLLRGIKYSHKTTQPAQVTLDWTLSDGAASVTVSQLITGTFELNYYSGGIGDVSDPWKLSNLADLRELSRNTFHWADYFIVTANINASGSANYDDTDDNADGNLFNDPNDATSTGTNTGFSPIGTVAINFTGNFNGQSYTISGLKIVRATIDYQGLFGVTSGATIRNVVMTGINITGDDKIGGLIGLAINSTVTNCSVAGAIYGGDDEIGGLIGETRDTDVDGCSYAGSVRGNSNTGGLIGLSGFVSLANKVIKNSYTSGTVTSDGNDVGGLIGESGYRVDSCYSTATLTSTDPTGDSQYGGLIGYTTADVLNSSASGNVTASGSSVGGLIGEAENCNIKWCFATGNATGVGNIGGLIGFYDDNAATQSYAVTNCYARGNATASGNDAGGLIGESQLNVSKCYSTGTSSAATNSGGLIGNKSGGTVTFSFWDKQTSGKTTSGGGTGKNTLEMKSPCTYEGAGWDFSVE